MFVFVNDKNGMIRVAEDTPNIAPAIGLNVRFKCTITGDYDWYFMGSRHYTILRELNPNAKI
jgi:hypothetical protein